VNVAPVAMTVPLTASESLARPGPSPKASAVITIGLADATETALSPSRVTVTGVSISCDSPCSDSLNFSG
jgi:hypothetical protein